MSTPTPTVTQITSTASSSLPPLTTPWSYECSNSWYYIPEVTWIIQDEKVPGYNTCTPPQMGVDTMASIYPTLSPGVCPVGYTIGAITTEGLSTKGLCCSQ